MIQHNQAFLLSVDSHFHIYRQFDLDTLLDSAWQQLVSANTAGSNDFTKFPVLFLTDDIDGTGFNLIEEKLTAPEQAYPIKWRVADAHQDENSLLLQKKDAEQMLLLRGYQLISSENIEVLVIGQKVGTEFNRQPVENIINAFKDQALVILPWAVGKWLGARGRVITAMMEKFNGRELFLGDNGGRPKIWKQVQQFDQASVSGYAILNGSDPLPLTGEEKRAGSYGFHVSGNHTGQLSSDLIIRLVKSESGRIRNFGQQETIFRFIINQLRLRIKK